MVIDAQRPPERGLDMVIDAHRHMWSARERYPAAFSDLPGQEPPPPADLDWESATRETVEEMDGAGVDRSVLVVADFAARLGDPLLSIEEENRLIVEAHRLHPDRIVPYYGIDPRRPGAADSFERAIKEWSVAGIKLHPTVGFFPHDRACYPIYELCAAYDLPVLFHSGPAFHPRLYSRFSHPLEYDQVAADFPNLTMVVGHASRDWWEDCIAVCRAHPNMVVEMSGWQTLLRDRPQETLHVIDRLRDNLGIERVMWGTDFPAVRHLMSLKECVAIYRTLPAMGKEHGYRFSDADVEAMLHGNAERLLKV
ncbi:MAG: amidohydrolase family protein [Chloroflexi bacterium]|nr:amidohydrolase family protein [Chloroflexota bacterium]